MFNKNNEKIMNELRKKKRINVTIAIFCIWLLCILIYFIFILFVKIPFNYSLLIFFSESILCTIMWAFFMIKIDWLKDLKTGRELIYLNISNILSAIRFSLVPLLITMFGLLTFVNGNFKIKIIIFIFAILVCLTDLFDGYIARTFNQVTRLGKVLDPVGDFLMITSFSILAYSNNVIEGWFFLLIMIRIPGLVIFSMLLMILDIKFRLRTSLLGKASIFYILCLLGLATLKLLLSFENEYYNQFLFIIQIIGAVLLIISSIEKILLLRYYLKNQDKIDLKKENIQF